MCGINPCHNVDSIPTHKLCLDYVRVFTRVRACNRCVYIFDILNVPLHTSSSCAKLSNKSIIERGLWVLKAFPRSTRHFDFASSSFLFRCFFFALLLHFAFIPFRSLSCCVNASIQRTATAQLCLWGRQILCLDLHAHKNVRLLLYDKCIYILFRWCDVHVKSCAGSVFLLRSWTLASLKRLKS